MGQEASRDSDRAGWAMEGNSGIKEGNEGNEPQQGIRQLWRGYLIWNGMERTGLSWMLSERE